jgi:hypothetical protein
LSASGKEFTPEAVAEAGKNAHKATVFCLKICYTVPQ